MSTIFVSVVGRMSSIVLPSYAMSCLSNSRPSGHSPGEIGRERKVEINIQNLNLFNPIFKSIFQGAGMGKEVNLINYEYQASTKKYKNSHK